MNNGAARWTGTISDPDPIFPYPVKAINPDYLLRVLGGMGDRSYPDDRPSTRTSRSHSSRDRGDRANQRGMGWKAKKLKLVLRDTRIKREPLIFPEIIILTYLSSDSSVVLRHAVIPSTLNLTSTCRCHYCGHSLVIDFGGATFDDSRKSKIINTRQYRGPE
eukprot:gene33236-42701_t